MAPSFVTLMSPSGEIRILSRPLGPSDVLMMLVTARAARMWLCAVSLLSHHPSQQITYTDSLKSVGADLLALLASR